jgi:predicted NBD/HSP70 family sugar kinase
MQRDKSLGRTQPNSPYLTKAPFDILVLDVGGTNVKLRATGQEDLVRIPSGRNMSARQMMSAVRRKIKGWNVQAVSIGLPGLVLHGRILHEPRNLGKGWVGFDFGKAFRLPVKVINDAAMQALGSYQGGRMLFLGLGTGLGSAFIVDGRLESLELAHLLYRGNCTYEDYVGARALGRLGRKKWSHHVTVIVKHFSEVLGADYVVLGGGNARKLTDLPPKCLTGDNENAFIGGFRLWEYMGATLGY